MLEKGKDDVKVDTMKKILITILNGDPLPDLLMHIIRFVMPSRNKELKSCCIIIGRFVQKWMNQVK